ncbi:hypothetical protein VNO78_22032 [Psophocarpus tetragonolobus]|uniref:Uncharacterized protein n=1 Tax=Psophocarpus tetragonolobus TaxID=3891 RepID=A0AAN9XIJ2_PSOTE
MRIPKGHNIHSHGYDDPMNSIDVGPVSLRHVPRPRDPTLQDSLIISHCSPSVVPGVEYHFPSLFPSCPPLTLTICSFMSLMSPAIISVLRNPTSRCLSTVCRGSHSNLALSEPD